MDSKISRKANFRRNICYTETIFWAGIHFYEQADKEQSINAVFCYINIFYSDFNISNVDFIPRAGRNLTGGEYMHLPQESFARIQQASELWKDVFDLSTPRSFKKGELVIRDGALVTSMYYILDGEVRMDMVSENGADKICWYFGPDTLLGETALFLQRPSLLYGVCTKPTKVRVFSREAIFDGIIPHHRELVLTLFHETAVKMRLLVHQIAMLGMDNMEARVCRYLRSTLSRDASGGLYSVPGITQRELAKLLGMHRVTCGRVLKELKEKGIIGAYSVSRVRIRDEAALYGVESAAKGAINKG